MDREQYQAALLQVDRILWEDWDPLGVNDQPAAFDEYTTYAPGVIRILIQGADVRRVSEHLFDIESKSMGFTCPAEKRLAAARKLEGLVLGRFEEE
ncbi:MAG: hypothetical protein WAO58_07235 [Fimbriimonadaceae bacterium]